MDKHMNKIIYILRGMSDHKNNESNNEWMNKRMSNDWEIIIQ